MTRSLVVRQVLRDAHARLGGAACGVKHVLVLRSGAGKAPALFGIELDGTGRVVGPMVLPAWEWVTSSWLRHARLAGQSVVAICRDAEVAQRAGLPRGSVHVALLEARIWRLGKLAWQQQRQRRGEEGSGRRWERRGGAGRRGRRRREPGVVFELGPWGEDRRALSHEEAAWVLEQALGV